MGKPEWDHGFHHATQNATQFKTVFLEFPTQYFCPQQNIGNRNQGWKGDIVKSIESGILKQH